MKAVRGFLVAEKNFAGIALLTGFLTATSAAFAADSPPPPPKAIPKEQLYGIANQFLERIGKSLKHADLMMSGAGKVELAEEMSGSQIPDNEPLLMHAVVGDYKLDLKQDIYAIKQGPRLMMSLGEFCSAADLSISVAADKGLAEGWFIREDQTFFLDANKRQVTIMGETKALNPEDVVIDGNDLLVSSALLERWFGLDIQYDFARLNLNIKTSQMLPIEAKHMRSRINVGNDFNTGPPKAPLLDEPYRMISKPNIDVSTTASHNKDAANVPASTYASWSALSKGDFAGYSMQGYAAGNSRVKLSAVRAALSKEDPDGKLLGPLKATYYQMGDSNTVSLPLVDPGGTEQGFALTNTPLGVTTQSNTNITGNALPDWDVELYNNDYFVDIQHIDGTGRYDFRDVQLFAGNNDFRLIFYGPQGEIREESRHVLVDPSKFEQSQGYYALSATRQMTTTWLKDPPKSPDVGAAHLVGAYYYGLGKWGTANAGLRLRSDRGENRAFAQTGWSTYLYDTYINLDAGYDLDTLERTTALSLRKNFGSNRTSLMLITETEGFDINNSINPVPTKYNLTANANGPLPVDEMLSLKKIGYNVIGSYGEDYTGGTITRLSSSLNGRYKMATVSGGFAYQRSEHPTLNGNETLGLVFTGRGFYKTDQWTLTSSTPILPEASLGIVEGEYIHRFDDTLSSKTELSYNIEPNIIEAGLGLNWRTEKATINPEIKANTLGMREMRVSMRFGLTAEPYSGDYQMVGKPMGEVGAVSARIFLDGNGDGYYSQGEELLPDINIKAMQSYRKATSNEDGIAFINDLPAGIITDIKIDPLTLTDIAYMSLFDSLSIRPRPGAASQIEFPIVMSGEMDGSGFVENMAGSKMPARDVMINLVAPDGRVEKTIQTAYDGYYSVQGIRPGVYYLVVDPSKSDTAGFIPPERLFFSPAGTTSYGHDIVLTQGYKIPFTFRGLEKRKISFKRGRVERPSDIAGEEIHLHLGPYHSRLGLTFAWYKFKIKEIPWKKYFSLTRALADIKADEKTGEMFIELTAQQNFSIKEASLACQTLIDMQFPCGVEVITYYTFDKLQPPVQEFPGSDYRQGRPLPKKKISAAK